jgi:flagellin
MSFSVNTNAGALAALGNLNRTTASLETTQSRINTGLKVASAKDNGATFAIAQTLRSDVAGYRAVSSSLDRASSELDVAMAGAEAISDLLIQMKEKAVAAKDEGLDEDSRTSLNDDYQQLLAQITSISENASFNGRNLLTGDTLSAITDAAGDSTITASVTSLTTTSLALDSTALTGGGGSTPNAAVTLGSGNPWNSGDQLAALNNYMSDNFSAIYNNGSAYDQSNGDFTNMGDISTVGVQIQSDFGVALGLVISGGNFLSLSAGSLFIEGTGGSAEFTSSPTSVSGGGADDAVDAVEAAIETVNTVMSDLGSTANRVDLQQQFAGSLSDSIDVGIGNLVDADMARESANLQAFQTKQQLGLQALSIANQAPQSVLSLFG